MKVDLFKFQRKMSLNSTVIKPFKLIANVKERHFIFFVFCMKYNEGNGNRMTQEYAHIEEHRNYIQCRQDVFLHLLCIEQLGLKVTRHHLPRHQRSTKWVTRQLRKRPHNQRMRTKSPEFFLELKSVLSKAYLKKMETEDLSLICTILYFYLFKCYC